MNGDDKIHNNMYYFLFAIVFILDAVAFNPIMDFVRPLMSADGFIWHVIGFLVAAFFAVIEIGALWMIALLHQEFQKTHRDR